MVNCNLKKNKNKKSCQKISKTKLKPSEDKEWQKAFEYYVNEGYSDSKADRLTAKELVVKFPRLKKYKVWI